MIEPSMAIEGKDQGATVLERFEYPACDDAPSFPEWNGWVEADEDAAPELADGPVRQQANATNADWEQRLAEETRRAFESGRERGREEGRREERDAQAPAAAQENERRRGQAAALVDEFQRARDCYLHAVEQEVVRLALAVAARILRREAQMDPLLLTGAVRVALGQLADASEIRLRVPAKEAELWKEAIALVPKLAVKPLVVADENLRLGDCAVESKVGTVDLGIRAQLGEIERGFFDRAGAAEASALPTAKETPQAEARA